jgi:hypothetical protein
MLGNTILVWIKLKILGPRKSVYWTHREIFKRPLIICKKNDLNKVHGIIFLAMGTCEGGGQHRPIMSIHTMLSIHSGQLCSTVGL